MINRNNKLLFYIILLISIHFVMYSCTDKNSHDQSSFSLAFLTDIHLRPDLNAIQGFNKAIDDVNRRNPDFVLTGGDLIADGLGVSYNKADELFDLYQKTILGFNVPVFNTIGNHDLYGINVEVGNDSLNIEYGKKMFEKRLGDSYYSFEHKGWKFIVLNSIFETGLFGVSEDGRFSLTNIGMIDDKQIEWIKSELVKTDPDMPIVISTHIPLMTVYTQRYFGTTVKNEESQIVINGKEVIDLFNDYNLKLVLQGHLHSVEDIFVEGVHYLTGGSVSGSWWKGPSHTGFEEGYLLVNFKDDEILNWDYIDFGWNAQSDP